MGWRDSIPFGKAAAREEAATTDTLTDVLERYELVEVVPNGGDPFVIVAERPHEVPGEIQLASMHLEGQSATGRVVTSRDPMVEIGSTSPSPFTGNFRHEYNNELRGLNGLRKCDQMRRSDGTVRGSLRLIKTPVLAARWFVEPEDKESKRDQNAAEFIWKCLTEYMSISWSQVLTEALLMCDFGYYMFEKVWEPRIIDGKERMVLKKLAPRHPMDVKQWILDEHGGPKAVIMFSDDPGEDGRRIDIEKLLVFTFDREAGNIEGISVLRSAYKHWYYKEQLYKIDAIQKERHGIGIPVIKLPVGFTKEDRSIADNLGRNLRTNERAHVVLPPNWDLLFAKLEGQPVNAMESIKHHDKEIMKNILAAFMEGGAKDEDQVMFLKATRFIADIVCEVFNCYLIPDIIKWNFERVGTPKLKARRIGESADWRTLSFAVRNLIGAGVIRPDDKLEEHLREEMDLPMVDVATIRQTKTPQMPGGQPAPGTPGVQPASPAAPGAPNQNGARAGMPRQSTSPVVAPPAGNAGLDRSGGK
jgi:hypothetical protein